MNVCIICQGDGVLQAGGHWYCMDHLEEGFKNVGAIVLTLLRGQHDPEVIARKQEKLQEWLDEEKPDG